MNVLLLAITDFATGNRTSILRIERHLKAAGHTVFVVDVADIELEDMPVLIQKHAIDTAIGLHGLHAGRLLADVSIPYAIIYGNTDLNVHMHHEQYARIITYAAHNAKALVAYNQDFVQKLKELWPNYADKVMHIPKSFSTHPSDFSLKKEMGFTNEDSIFLLPSGLREVKDPRFLVDEIALWHKQDPHIHLVIIGVDRDREYADAFKKDVAVLDGIHVYAPIAQEDLWAAMQESFAVLNTSKHECSPNAPMEAMDIGTPVLVRDIPGNSYVEHDKTGFLFSTPAEFRKHAQVLINDSERRSELIKNAKEYIRKEYSSDREQKGYVHLIDKISLF